MDPRIQVRIFKERIVHNLEVFRDAQKLPVAPVLKSNAYGHGLIEVGKIVEEQNVPFICLNSLGEAEALRAAGVRTPLLILGYTPLEAMRACTLQGLSFGIISIEELRRIGSMPVTINLEIDTGMHRHGILPEEIEEAVSIVVANPNITLDGVYSHLADGDTENSVLTKTQIERWNAAVNIFRARCPHIRYYHLSATTGVAYAANIDANLARLGIGLYGFNVGLTPLDLRPALEMRTRITSIRTVPKGEMVGYNGTYTAFSERRGATIPVGYNEGIDRRLSGNGSMLVQGKACPTSNR
jgi:alanine racemase